MQDSKTLVRIFAEKDEKSGASIYLIFMRDRVDICEKMCYFKAETKRKDSVPKNLR